MGNPRGFWWLGGGALIVSLSLGLLIDRGVEDPPTPSFTSLAVLPFDGPSTDTDLDHLATGLSLDLLRRLQILAALQCSPRGQVSAWQQRDGSRHNLARRLGAEILISGHVRVHSGRVHLTLEIFDARDETLLSEIELTESRERIFDLQRLTAQNVAAALQVPIQRSERPRFEADPTRSLKAWEYAVQGRVYLEDLANPRGPLFAADRFQRAIQHDPDFAHARVRLSEALWVGHVLHKDPPDLAEAELLARGVLNRHPRMGSAAAVLTKILLTTVRSNTMTGFPPPEIKHLAKPDEALRDVATGMRRVGRLESAEGAWRAAEILGEGLWLNSYAFGQFLLLGGRHGEAAIAFAKAAEESPTAMTWPRESLISLKLAAGDLSGAIEVFESFGQDLTNVETIRQIAAAYTILGQLAAAERMYERALEIAPLEPQIYQEMGDLLMRRDRRQQAGEHYAKGLHLLEEGLESSPADPDLRLRLAVMAAKAQDCPRALPLATTLRRHAVDSPTTYHDLAIVFALCEDPEMAINSLRAALGHGLPPELVRTRPEFQDLLRGADFQALLAAAEGPPPSP